jgi:minor extracellular serine protease Vpr
VNSLRRRVPRRVARARVRRLSVLLVGFVLAAALALGAQSAVAVSGDGEPDAVAPFAHLDITSVGNFGGFKPASLNGERTVSVIVKLKGAPVGDRQAEAKKQGRTLTKAERDAIRAQLRSQQGPVVDRISGLGGTVFERYQDAYNGLAVRIPMKNLAALAGLPEVAAIQPDRIVTRDNTAGVQYIGGNQAWTDLGLTGNNVKVGIIDSGIDYFHANFGGSGNPDDFKNNNGTIIEPGSFPTAKVVGGTDFVGDAFNSSSGDAAKTVPHPDPDPADCDGHGSHVAGTAAGFGVLSNGHTYTGPYDATTYTSNTFRIGPGVAPKAKLFAYRVFGCKGSTSDAIIVAALDQALEDGVNVVNLSLGSPFGRNDAADAEAANTDSAAGLMVVASAGNSGPSGYVTGAPAAADRALSVAAIDASSPTFPGANIALSTGQTILAQLSNGPFQDDPGASLPGGSLSVVVLRKADHSVSLGCNTSDYNGVNVSGKLVVVLRGVCARAHKAILGQKAGAAAVAMINTSTAFPPFEGQVTSDPDTGEVIDLTIPFFGIRGLLGSSPASDGDKLVAADGGTANSFTSTTVPNTGYQRAASFTSGGARNVDSAVKPEIAAPGVSVKSTAIGTGNQGTRLSGTSMAAPMTTGSAALVIEAHPSWTPEAIKAALINTSDASSAKILGYNLRIAGTGVVQPRRAVDTLSYATTTGGRDTLDFDNEAIATGPFTKTLSLTLHNTTGSAITYNLSNAANSSLGNTVSFSANPVVVPAGGTASVDVTQTLSAAAVAALPDASTQIFGGISTARGAVVATPTTSGAGLYALRIPYIFIPRGVSNVAAGARSTYTHAGGVSNATVPLTNNGIHRSVADTFAWGIHDANDTTGGEDSFDVRDVGVQVQPKSLLCGSSTSGECSHPDDKSLVFAINTYGQSSNPSVNEFDVVIDTQNNGKPDFFVVGVDFGEVTGGSFDGRFGAFVFDGAGNLIDIRVASAPMNGSTIELPVLASEIGLFPGVNSTRFNYHVNAFSIVPGEDLFDTTANGSFRVDLPPVSSGNQFPLDPGGSATLPVSVDRGKNAGTPQLGWLVVGLDDANGGAQADEVPIGTP